ncbi:unnamed protein product [Gongylonema pulchrum]|uniref:Glycosyltransferase family 92 protein n=1 Tax=Gongylonema pulchrum TaxID=637853 RepID=A0A183CY55_9BILA|nr:unnamed protein product [Gongylonema pulchrum]
MEELLSKSQQTLPQAFLSRADKPSLHEPVKLLDARVVPNGPRKHQMAVCVLRSFLLVDWTSLAQFFEIYRAQGVTKFYLYIQSMSPEVDAFLKLYQKSDDLDLELISWGPLPKTASTSENDPNLQIDRGELALSMNDCVLRSRGIAKYTIWSDFDEIVVVLNNLTLFEMIEKQRASSNKSGSYVIPGSFAHYEVIFSHCMEHIKRSN